jgi:non-ribosomal peptide synthetase component F
MACNSHSQLFLQFGDMVHWLDATALEWVLAAPTPVPLPASAWLLLGGIATTFGLARGQRR